MKKLLPLSRENNIAQNDTSAVTPQRVATHRLPSGNPNAYPKPKNIPPGIKGNIYITISKNPIPSYALIDSIYILTPTNTITPIIAPIIPFFAELIKLLLMLIYIFSN